MLFYSNLYHPNYYYMIKLIVLDVDGVLCRGEGQPFDLSLLQRLASINRQARAGKPVPAVTLNTGRPSTYVEAVIQVIDGWQPALYENGAGLYYPQTYQFQATSLLTVAHQTMLREIADRLEQTVVKRGQAHWQPGKTVCYTLLARPPLTIADFMVEVEKIVADISDQFVVTPAFLALNIYPAGINKGTGLHWLAEVTGIDPTEMIGIGDSLGDIDFLQWVGYPAAPANAADEVKAVAQYVSPYADAAAVHDILDYWNVYK